MGRTIASPGGRASSALPILAVALALAAWTGCASPQPARTADTPNIVLLMADDLGWTDTGAYGSSYYETPNIDRLAREGLRFTDAYANPNCAPTRAALLTGRYSPRTGIYTVDTGERGLAKFRKMIPAPNVTNLPLSEVTFGEALQLAGYATAVMGKWHMGTGEFAPEKQGFDFNVGGNQTGSPKGGYFAPWDNPQMPTDAPKGQHLADRLAAEAVKWMTLNRERPFLLYLPFYSVHSPIQGKADLVTKYEAKEPVGGHRNPTYAAMVETLDSAIGQVLTALDDLDLTRDTVVIFYSDNGGVGGYAEAGVEANLEVTSNAPLRGGKGMLYEGGVRVPLIVRYPGVTPPGSVTGEPVMCVDLFPTLLDIVRTPGPMDREIDGVSFYSALRDGHRDRPRGPIYWHFPGYLEGRREVGAWRTTPAGAIRENNYKLIEFFETGEVELYNLTEDISERQNLAEVDRPRAEEMRNKLAEWRRLTNAPMPQPQP
ncbi:MAG: sulfatase-like hydrolase/transferase [Acidobacteria bacterium]|nr:sulfatase-like hydrolase/transferase [Acidobacteriota bacterium]